MIRKWIGKRWLAKALERERGEADVLGFVKGNDGWELIPCDIETDGDEQWFIPLDPAERRFPADGVPSEPSTFLGTPIAFGFKEFGALSQLTQVEIGRDVVIDLDKLQADETDPDADQPGDGGSGGASGRVSVRHVTSISGRMRQWVADWVAGFRTGWENLQWAKGWAWTQGKTSALIIEQDGDAALVGERANYNAGAKEPEWYICDKSGYRYDARGAGAPPEPLGTATVGLAVAEIPKLVAPSLARVGRNLIKRRIKDGTKQYGGSLMQDGETALTDGGINVDGGIPEPKVARPANGAIEVEERAFVNPEDVKLLGGAQETQDKIETLLEQVEAKENTPGGSMGRTVLHYGMIILAFILGAQLGGGDAGGGVTNVIPMMLEPMAWLPEVLAVA